MSGQEDADREAAVFAAMMEVAEWIERRKELRAIVDGLDDDWVRFGDPNEAEPFPVPGVS